MIIYGLLKAILFILDLVAGILGPLIPDFPDVINNFLDRIADLFTGSIPFISYFFYWDILVAIITILIAWHSFKVIKEVIMKVIGHFFAN